VVGFADAPASEADSVPGVVGSAAEPSFADDCAHEGVAAETNKRRAAGKNVESAGVVMAAWTALLALHAVLASRPR